MPTASGFGIQSPTYTNISASALIKTGIGRLRGIFCASASGTPSLKLWDNTSGATTILVNTFTPVAGTYYNFGDVIFGTGLYITVAATCDVTVFYF